uniref:Uncharacterized protein n=1 Tax=Polytomella parva TaxID=51329 RepID=A0A7S0VAR5_9CHLO|mmetsp:Transcript_31728/g.57649  ORF Transcript_31728/g.57649 Transcript_31728/m.57649 type:complete len:397 (+) Transcript_31728:185-1375(+)
MHFVIRVHGVRSKHAPCPIIVKDAELDLEALRTESSQNDPNSLRCNGRAKPDTEIYKGGFWIQKLTDSTEDCFKRAIEIGDEKVRGLRRAEISRVKSTMGENDNEYHCQVSSNNDSVVDVRSVKDKYSKKDEILTVNCSNAVGLNNFLTENGNCNKILKEDNNYLGLSNEEEDGVIFIDDNDIELKTEKMVEGINSYIVSKNNNHTNEQRLLGSNKLLNGNQASSNDDGDDSYELLPKQYTFLLSVNPNEFPSLEKSSLDLVLKLRLVRWADLNRRTMRLVIPREAITHNLSAINWDPSLQDYCRFDYQFISQIETYDLNRYAAELEKQEVTPDVKPKPKRKSSQNEGRNPKTKRNGGLSSRSSPRLIELAKKLSKEVKGEKEERVEEYENEEDDE